MRRIQTLIVVFEKKFVIDQTQLSFDRYTAIPLEKERKKLLSASASLFHWATALGAFHILILFEDILWKDDE